MMPFTNCDLNNLGVFIIAATLEEPSISETMVKKDWFWNK